MKNTALRLAGAFVAANAFTSSLSAQIIVDEFLTATPTPVVDEWYASDVGPGGTASIVDLTGVGGNLETNQPLRDGAALLTTDFTNAAKARVGTFDNFGNARTTLPDARLSYSYHKANVPVGNAFAAPSLKLDLYNPGGTGSGDFDSWGQLVYEPTWNQSGSAGISVAVPTDTWTNVNITATDGLWWWTGGFGEANSFGGPPLRTLADWVTVFSSGPDAADFGGAIVSGLSVGVGSYNQGQRGYFDNVGITIGSVSKTYNFEVCGPAVPEPSVLLFGLTGLTLGGLVLRRRR